MEPSFKLLNFTKYKKDSSKNSSNKDKKTSTKISEFLKELKIKSKISRLFKSVTTYALVGPSGTGKSFRARLVADKYNIEAIIDDGLLIKDERILSGKTAKRADNYMGAVRTALFDEKSHRDQVHKAFKEAKIKSVLIIGTSVKMIKMIAERLQLPIPEEINIFNIEKFQSPEEIEAARISRKVGKHVIPVPAVEIKRKYPGIFYKSFFTKNSSNDSVEKSLVRPEFSKAGKVVLSEAALCQMVTHCVNVFDKNIRVKKITIKSYKNNFVLKILIDVPFGTQLSGQIYKLQEYITDQTEKFTGNLIDVNIVIDKIIKLEEPKAD